jgi:hypothetical protein
LFVCSLSIGLYTSVHILQPNPCISPVFRSAQAEPLSEVRSPHQDVSQSLPKGFLSKVTIQTEMLELKLEIRVVGWRLG